MQHNKILVPLDSKQPLDQAMSPLFNYAELVQAELRLFSVVEGDQSYWYDELTPELRDHQLAEQVQRLERMAAELKQKHPQLTISSDAAYGIPFVEIIKQADQHQCTLIGIDARRVHKKKACEYGSTTRRLMRKSGVPIWTQHNHNHQSVKRIAAAIDVASTVFETQQLNLQILKQAMNLAQLFGAEVLICHAWRFDVEGYVRKWSNWDDAQVAKASKDEKNQRLQKLENLVQQAGLQLDPSSLVLLEGQAERVIPTWAKQENIDLMVMGTLCRSGVAGLLVGNTAERLMNGLSCSLVTLKPEGFKSPVLV